MIINKETKTIQTRSDKPNENWMGEDYYLLDDNSKLAQIIIDNYPNIIYTIENDIITNVEIDIVQKETKENMAVMQQEIASLKADLSNTDYKITKCMEYQLAELELPYDVQELHTTRQTLRDRINELESELEQ